MIPAIIGATALGAIAVVAAYLSGLLFERAFRKRKCLIEGCNSPRFRDFRFCLRCRPRHPLGEVTR